MNDAPTTQNDTTVKLHALFLVDESGVEWFAGGFTNRELAEAKGKASGKGFVVKEVEV
jgi:hypothetical protein